MIILSKTPPQAGVFVSPCFGFAKTEKKNLLPPTTPKSEKS